MTGFHRGKRNLVPCICGDLFANATVNVVNVVMFVNALGHRQVKGVFHPCLFESFFTVCDYFCFFKQSSVIFEHKIVALTSYRGSVVGALWLTRDWDYLMCILYRNLFEVISEMKKHRQQKTVRTTIWHSAVHISNFHFVPVWLFLFWTIACSPVWATMSQQMTSLTAGCLSFS